MWGSSEERRRRRRDIEEVFPIMKGSTEAGQGRGGCECGGDVWKSEKEYVRGKRWGGGE